MPTAFVQARIDGHMYVLVQVENECLGIQFRQAKMLLWITGQALHHNMSLWLQQQYCADNIWKKNSDDQVDNTCAEEANLKKGV